MAESMYGPVTDWATDFDHADPEYNRHAHAIWKDLRDRCPVAHSDRYGGVWLPLAYDLIREVAYDTEHFSNCGVLVVTKPFTVPPPVGVAPPISSDPPFHAHARRLLLPAFAPKRIAAWEERTRELCRARLDDLGPMAAGSVVDGAQQYAQHIPVGIIARMLGCPPEDDDRLRGFVHTMLESVNRAPEAQKAARKEVDAYLDAVIESHRREPRDTLTSYLLNATLLGEPLSHDHVRGSLMLLILAGIDTTWSAIGSSLWHLATHPGHLARLVREPGLMHTAIEEMLRAYAPVTMARMVVKERDFHGHRMKPDDHVLLPFPAANRDPAAFDRPDEVVLDREVNRHAAFGLGIHRCIGSNLARLELRIALEEFIARFPAFELADPAGVRWSTGQVRGPRQLPLRILATREAPASVSASPTELPAPCHAGFG